MQLCKNRSAVVGICLPLAFSALTGCFEDVQSQSRTVQGETASFPSTFARQWMTNAFNSIKGDTLVPTQAARVYAYVAIGIYESVVHGMPEYQSLAGQLNGLDSLPTPDPDLEYDWPSVLAQTLHTMMLASVPPFPGAVQEGPYIFPNRIFFEYTTTSQASLTTLGPVQLGYRRAAGVPEPVMQNSIAFGTELGNALAAWMAEDTYYDTRYKGWIPPVGPDKWVPAGFTDQAKIAIPAEPYYGTIRPLVMTSPDECSPANLGLAPPPFSTVPGSQFYEDAKDVWEIDLNSTDEQRDIARFWEDGPGVTGTPAGHWVAITTKLVRNDNLAKAAAAYAWVSMGFLDSFIAVWQAKYTYNLLRPTTYIRRHIDPGFFTFLGTPQFPSYPSGHSGQSGASGRLLDTMFPTATPFVDDTKTRRGFVPRTFATFEAAAQEAAVSRFYGGIHYNFDDNDGLVMGHCVADNIIERVSLRR